MNVLEIENLQKTFRLGFMRRKVQAVRGVSLVVPNGEVFGLLGPNGAGKTTTIKSVLRLIFPTHGVVRLFGVEGGDRNVMRRIGYLPENPYAYQYLKPLEFLDFCGRLMGLSRHDRTRRALNLIDRVGLTHAMDRSIGKFSKGMMQRIGLAQALLHDPEFLILDEPMSGLDPIGRKEVRDIIEEQRKQGKTIVFTTHILADVERLCDRIAVIHRGKVTAYGKLSELLKPEGERYEIDLANVSDALKASLDMMNVSLAPHRDGYQIMVQGAAGVPGVLNLATQHQARILAVNPERQTLEDLFVRGAVRGIDG